MKKQLVVLMGIVIGLGGALPIASVQANLLRSVDAEGASINSSNWKLTDNGRTYSPEIFNNPDRPWFSSGYDGSSKSIGFRIDTKASGNDKINYGLVYDGSIAIPFVSQTSSPRRYIGYAMKIGGNSSLFGTPSKWLALTQFRQNNSVQGYPPILTHRMKVGTLKYQVAVRDDQNRNVGTPLKIIHTSSNMQRGKWVEYIFDVRLSYNGDGKSGTIKFFHNGTEVKSWNGDCGYKPAANGGVAGMGKHPWFLYGIYRGTQNQDHQVVFDNIKYATTKASANP